MENLEKLQQYRAVIRQLLTEYASYKPSHGDIEIQTVFDPEGDHYQVVALGWNKKERIYGCSIHVDIKSEKIWIQVNNTELDLGQDLVDRGVAAEDIVVGFQPPYLRLYSGYATA
jgi:hypothetical protein